MDIDIPHSLRYLEYSFYSIGCIYIQWIAKAIASLNKALEVDPENKEALMALAVSYTNDLFRDQVCINYPYMKSGEIKDDRFLVWLILIVLILILYQCIMILQALDTLKTWIETHPDYKHIRFDMPQFEDVSSVLFYSFYSKTISISISTSTTTTTITSNIILNLLLSFSPSHYPNTIGLLIRSISQCNYRVIYSGRQIYQRRSTIRPQRTNSVGITV